MTNPTEESVLGTVDMRDLVYTALSRVAVTLGVSADRSAIDLQALSPNGELDFISCLDAGAQQLGIVSKETDLRDAGEIFEIVQEGYPVLLTGRFGENCRLLRRTVGRRVEFNLLETEVSTGTVSKRELGEWLDGDPELHVLVTKEAFECSSTSAAPSPAERSHHHVRHMSPTRRFLGLLKLDARDVWTVALFALVAGVLGLATPLAIESLVNVVSWGIYLQPLLILAVMLLVCLGLSATLRILQTVTVEIIQRRQLVRIVSDLAHRFPRADRSALVAEYPRELANRLFDIMTIQKATATLLLDGMSLLLTTILGLLLLAFYHPFLLGFDIVLLICMISVTWALGRGGIRTAIQESVTKYRIVQWLQDVIDSPAAFRVNGGQAMAIDRANRLAAEYVDARTRQFRVVIRQVVFAVGLQVVASTALLGLGGWLVIQGQLTLGQLVASELVVTIVVGAFSKAGKSLEKFYDLMAGVDKVGHLLDIPLHPNAEVGFDINGPAAVSWDNLRLKRGAQAVSIAAQEVAAGSQLALTGDHSACSLLLECMSGLQEPADGLVEIAGYDASRVASGAQFGRAIGYASSNEIFRATLRENIALGRPDVGRGRVRELLHQLGLWDAVSQLEDGMDTLLQTEGYPLARTQVSLVLLAQAMAARPRLLLIDGLLDELQPVHFDQVWLALTDRDAPWTLVVATCQDRIADRCGRRLVLESLT